jgi:hypothetical protein
LSVIPPKAGIQPLSKPGPRLEFILSEVEGPG